MTLISAPDGMLLNLNQACVEILGIEDEGVHIGQSLAAINPTWRDFDETGKRIPWRELPVTQALQGITTRNKEMAVLRKNGTMRWEMVNAAPIYNEIGEMIAAFVVFQDITDRKRAEEALRESEETYRSLLTSLNAGVVVHAPDTSILLANPMACSLLGLSQNQLLGKEAIDPYWRFLRDDGSDMPLDEYPVNQVLASASPLRNRVVGVQRSKADDVVWVLVNGFAASYA